MMRAVANLEAHGQTGNGMEKLIMATNKEKNDFWNQLSQPTKHTCFNCKYKNQRAGWKAPCNGCMEQFPKLILWRWDGETYHG